ncbi:alpha/beta fold hydrolase [Rheinheimera texasensis]|uniref:alpha/beta fold hydrolase n=1 Tax=Rheinheimera texasensis TaxID=306205 RepID=UPI0012FF1165|nr:alpha/beta fold hydrolase [Rheinheimera texasensis]
MVSILVRFIQRGLVFVLLSFAALAQAESGYAGNIYYQTFGSGTPVLIINGGPGLDSAGFEAVAKTIAAQGYQTILFDQRGTGHSKLSSINADTIQLALMVQDIEQLRQQLHIKQWVILGHSFGGMLGAAYAAKYPQHIRKLIFSSSGGLDLQFRDQIAERLLNNLSLQEQIRMQMYQLRQRSGDDSEGTRDTLAQLRARAYVVDKSKAPLIAARLKVVNMTINQLVFADLEKNHFDLKAQFKQFKAPVLVLQGENDIISTETAQTIAGSFSKAELVLLPQCAHYGWLDQPDLYYSAVFRFLKANS